MIYAQLYGLKYLVLFNDNNHLSTNSYMISRIPIEYPW